MTRSGFQVNTYKSETQYKPNITSLTNGGFVVVWESGYQEETGSDDFGIYGQLYDGAGSEIGNEFHVNYYSAGNQSNPLVTPLPEGGFVITWTSQHESSAWWSGGGDNVYARHYDGSGTGINLDFRVNTSREGNQENSSITSLNDGGFVIAWASQHNGAWEVYAQRYDSTVNTVGGEFRVSTNSESEAAYESAVTNLSDGGFIVTWRQATGDETHIYAQRYGEDGSTIGSNFKVNSSGDRYNDHPSIVGLEDGGFIVSWASNNQHDNNNYNIFGQIYDKDGNVVDSQFKINTALTDDRDSSRVISLNDGGFLITWQGNGDLYAQKYDGSGAKVGNEFIFFTNTAISDASPSPTSLQNGDILITWAATLEDPYNIEILGQRFDASFNKVDQVLPEINFNSIVSDGLEFVSSKEIKVDLSSEADRIIEIDYVVTGGTATGSGADYTLANGTLSIAAGQTSGKITIADIVDDSVYEGDETVIVTLSNPINAVLGSDNIHTFTITNDDSPTTGDILIQGAATQGQTLAIDMSGFSDVNGIGTLSYQWNRDGSDIIGATNSTYTLTQDDVNAAINATISYSHPTVISAEVTNEGNVHTIDFHIDQAQVASDEITSVMSFQLTMDGSGTATSSDGLIRTGIFHPLYGTWNSLTTGDTGLDEFFYNYAINLQTNFDKNIFTSSDTWTSTFANVSVPIVSEATTWDFSGIDIIAAELVPSTLLIGQLVVKLEDDVTDFDIAVSGKISGRSDPTATNVFENIAPFTIDVKGNVGNTDVQSIGSSATPEVTNVNDNPSGQPILIGLPIEDGMLAVNTEELTDADGLGSLSYQWYRGGSIIDGATDSTYQTVQADVGAGIGVLVSYVDGFATQESIFSQSIPLVENVNDVPEGDILITGTTTQGHTLTADTSSLSDADGLGSLSYQWLRDDSDINGATSSTYSLTQEDVRASISVNVSYTDNYSTVESVTSSTTSPIVNINDSPTGGVLITGAPIKGSTLIADTSSIIDEDGLGVFSYQWHKDGTVINGSTSSTYTLLQADVGSNVRVEVSYTDGEGTAESVASASTTLVEDNYEFQVNTYTIDEQNHPSIATLSDGGFIISWQSYGQDGDGDGIFAQLYDSFGNVLGDEFQINTYTTGGQSYPSITGIDDGGFVVTWVSGDSQDGDYYGIYGQQYDSSGKALRTEFQINTYIKDAQIWPSVSPLNDGGFIVTWASGGQDGDNLGIFGQRYDSSGNASGMEFQVNTYTSDYQVEPSVSSLNDGGFVVTWQSDGQDGDGYGIYGQLYDSAGAKSGDEFRVNTVTSGWQDNSDTAGLSDGGFIVTWATGEYLGIFGQRYDSSGNASGMEFQVNTYTADYLVEPSVSSLNDGGFVVTWQSDGGYGIYGQRYDSSGNIVGSEFQINTITSDGRFNPSVTGLSDGGFVVTWTSDVQDSDGYGVYAQRFDASGNKVEQVQSPPPLIIDFNTTISNGLESTSSKEIRVDISELSSEDVTVDYSLTGTALGSDYTIANGTLMIEAGYTWEKITIADIVDDTLDEANETIILTLSNPNNGVLGFDHIHTYTIIDNDDAPSLGFDSANSSDEESITSSDILVNLSSISSKDIGVDYTVTGTASGGGSDHTLQDGRLTIFAGETSGTITIADIVDDDIKELDKTIILTLSNPINATLDNNLVHTYTLTDDDMLVFFDTLGHDFLTGSEDADVFNIGAGKDVIDAGAGDDTIILTGNSSYEGLTAHNVGSSNDVATNVKLDLTGKVKLETVVDGGADADTVNLSANGDAFFLHDSFSGFHRDLTLTTDTHTGSASTQRILNVETINGLGGDDIIDLTSPDYSLAGQVITINGGTGNDVIWGSDATETLIGGDGNDILFGGSGNDILTGGSGKDIFEFTRTAGSDTITDFQSGADSIKIYSDYTFNVSKTDSTTSDYSIDDQSDPTLYLARGKTYTFEMSGNGHPFYIKSTSSTSGTSDEYTDGVTRIGSANSGSDGDKLQFIAGVETPDTLFYQCSAHSEMLGKINIVDRLSDTILTSGNNLIWNTLTIQSDTAIELDDVSFVAIA